MNINNNLLRKESGINISKRIKELSKYKCNEILRRLCIKDLRNSKLLGDINKITKRNVDIMHFTIDDIHLSIKSLVIDEIPKSMYSKNARTNDVWIEVIVLELCKILIYEDICPNVPLSYGNYICNSCELDDVSVDVNKKCVIMMSEYALLGDLQNFLLNYFEDLSKMFSSSEIIMNILFQIYAGLYALQKYFNITHHDLHINNILVHKMNISKSKLEFIEYKIDGYKYYMPNLGILITIWDFGYALLPNKLMRNDVPEYYTNLMSILNNKRLKKTKKIEPDFIQIPRLSVDYYRITMFIKRILRNRICIFNIIEDYFNSGKMLDEVLMIFRDMYKYMPHKSNIIYKYSFDKKIRSEVLKMYNIDNDYLNLILEEKLKINNDILRRKNYISVNELSYERVYSYNDMVNDSLKN